jgi:Photosynthetic reaction centre cytochrome C subunit
MKKILWVMILPTFVILFSSQNNPPEPPRRDRPPVNQDSLAAERMKFVTVLLDSLKGKEKMPVDSVFKNIKVFKGMPVDRFLGMMNNGWGRSLGVNCNGCHNVKDWASDQKEEKDAARDMVAMTNTINQDLLKKIKGMEKSNIGCNTCHNGRKHPK